MQNTKTADRKLFVFRQSRQVAHIVKRVDADEVVGTKLNAGDAAIGSLDPNGTQINDWRRMKTTWMIVDLLQGE